MKKHPLKEYPFVNCLKDKAFDVKNCHRKKSNDRDKILFNICDDFVLDCAKIIQSKAYRRLMDKTQVFYSPDNPHVRSRMTHTMEVTAMAIEIANVLGLNANLVQAIALGHDIGHVPFGHVGENFLSQFTKKPFKHSLFGSIIAEKVERWGDGLNLTEETLSGIKIHSGADFKIKSEIEEYKVVQLADKISYLFSDLNDAIRFGYLSPSEIPYFFNKLGLNQSERVYSCLLALFNESFKNGFVSFSGTNEAMLYNEARNWMFQKVYPRANNRINLSELELCFELIRKDSQLKKYDPIVIFSILTENGARKIAKEKRISIKTKKDFGISEIIPCLKKNKVYCNDFALMPELN